MLDHSLISGGRGGISTDPASSGVLHITASIWRVNSSPKGLKIASRCVVIGSDGSPTTSQEIWQRPSPNSCSKMRADDVETRTPRHWKDAASRTIRLVAIESLSCWTNSSDLSGSPVATRIDTELN